MLYLRYIIKKALLISTGSEILLPVGEISLRITRDSEKPRLDCLSIMCVI